MRTRIIYKNTEGKEAVFSDKRPLYLGDIEGFDALENDLSTTINFGQDGATLTNQRYGVRDLTIEGTIAGQSDEEVQNLKRELIRIFNRNLAGTLYYQRNGKEYMIDVCVERAPKFTPLNVNFAEAFMIQLVALDPYFMDTTFYDNLIPLTRVVNAFEFPLNIIDNFEFAKIVTGDITEVVNDGDIEVGAVFYLDTMGDVVNPKIYDVLKQEYFGFQGAYPKGTKFEISTVRNKKYVKKIVGGVETNAMPERMKDSAFLTFSKGKNYFQVQADAGLESVIVNLKFRPLVIGV